MVETWPSSLKRPRMDSRCDSNSQLTLSQGFWCPLRNSFDAAYNAKRVMGDWTSRQLQPRGAAPQGGKIVGCAAAKYYSREGGGLLCSCPKRILRSHNSCLSRTQSFTCVHLHHCIRGRVFIIAEPVFLALGPLGS